MYSVYANLNEGSLSKQSDKYTTDTVQMYKKKEKSFGKIDFL